MSNFLSRKMQQKRKGMLRGVEPGQNAGFVQAIVMIGFLFVGFFSGQMLFQDGVTLKTEQAISYFTPGDNCTQRIVDIIDGSKNQIYMQAYGFTSDPIGRALMRAADRGVIVRILLDKSNAGAMEHSTAKTSQDKRTHRLLMYLKDKAEIKIDYVPGIAHNKVIIADDVLITGSFNFTDSAQKKNAENIIIINNATLAKRYENNWYKRYENANRLSADKKSILDRIKKTINITNDDNESKNNTMNNEVNSDNAYYPEAESDLEDSPGYNSNQCDESVEVSDIEKDVQDAVKIFTDSTTKNQNKDKSISEKTAKNKRYRKTNANTSETTSNINKQKIGEKQEEQIRMSRNGKAWRVI